MNPKDQMKTIEQIKRSMEQGEISREDFWLGMQQSHMRLRDYQALLDGGQLSTIEVARDELRVVTSDGVKLVWHPEDLRTAANILVNTGTYEPVESAALMKGATGATVICDIGANIGFYSLHWAKVVAPGGKVHAFEPVPTTYDRLVRNVALNEAADIVRANNQGVGDKRTSVTIYLPAFSGSGAASIKNLHPEEQSIEVEAQIDTLDAYFEQGGIDGFDLAKIDVEGAELMVIKGGMASISRHKPLLFIELLRKWSKPFGYHPNDVIMLLRQIGYRCYSFEGNVLRAFDEMTDETVQTNFFFAHPERHQSWLEANGIAAS
ncbi:FkbM family methyltransferase [Sphingomonas sp.]|uniref:FkbM family methyltransferase n=1 Tax=Sphingomonas sp. TaxID=28214 RepID=UPI002FC86E71